MERWTIGRDVPEERALLERDRVEAWRLHILLRAGYAEHRADLLARDETVDLHLAVRLLQAGCDEKVAVRILT